MFHYFFFFKISMHAAFMTLFKTLKLGKRIKRCFFFAPAETVYMGSPGCGWMADGSGWQVGWQWYQWCPCTGHYCAPHSGPGRWGQSLPTQQCTGLPPEWSCWCYSLPPDHCCLTKKRGVNVEQIAENGELSHIWKVRDSPGTLLNTAEQL